MYIVLSIISLVLMLVFLPFSNPRGATAYLVSIIFGIGVVDTYSASISDVSPPLMCLYVFHPLFAAKLWR
ncbi:hypothetical protein EJD97_025464 [Solanum chilense]|uniref:Uncharacterized protein n=1 Tax=Solanum chilense TaxID=4083 RepID=A0A6N2APK0_SOLCI|nr:hypothetical protein EJD97_025464 [Solanum chilense]